MGTNPNLWFEQNKSVEDADELKCEKGFFSQCMWWVWKNNADESRPRWFICVSSWLSSLMRSWSANEWICLQVWLVRSVMHFLYIEVFSIYQFGAYKERMSYSMKHPYMNYWSEHFGWNEWKVWKSSCHIRVTNFTKSIQYLPKLTKAAKTLSLYTCSAMTTMASDLIQLCNETAFGRRWRCRNGYILQFAWKTKCDEFLVTERRQMSFTI